VNGSGGADGGVTGVGGSTGSASDLLSALKCIPGVSQLFGVSACPKDNKHWVKVELRYKDTREFVPVAECRILQGSAVIDSGPLATGVLEAKGLPGGTYSVTFPDIDASEWAEG
jgi:hypothetical protein